MPNPASSGTGYLTVSGLIQMMGEKMLTITWINYIKI